MTSTTTEARADEVFDRAADLIETNGLYADDFWPSTYPFNDYVPGSPCCTIGALIIAQRCDGEPVKHDNATEFDTDEHVQAFARHLRLHSADRIAPWSDARTAVQVVAELRAAAQQHRTQNGGAA